MTYCWRGGSLPEKAGDRDPQFVDRALTTRLERTAQTAAAGGVSSNTLGKVLHPSDDGGGGGRETRFDKKPSVAGKKIKMEKLLVDVT